MSRQNIFDNETFFNGYKVLRESSCNANDLIEQPAMRKLLPDLKGKTVLDLGCGYGHNCIDFVKRGADKVVGIDISEKKIIHNRCRQIKSKHHVKICIRRTFSTNESWQKRHNYNAHTQNNNTDKSVNLAEEIEHRTDSFIILPCHCIIHRVNQGAAKA